MLSKNYNTNQAVLFNPEYEKDLALGWEKYDQQMDDKGIVLREM